MERSAAHLCQARDVSILGRCSGNALIAPLLWASEIGLSSAAFALDVQAPALFAQSRFALAIDIALVSQDVPVSCWRVSLPDNTPHSAV